MGMNYSIDLETLGTRYDSYILSIGVAEFNIETGVVSKTFHKKTLCGEGFNIDIATVMWWLGQSDDARESITGLVDRGCVNNISQALIDLSRFISNKLAAKVWGNGASFDITILEHAYHKCNMNYPWHYRNIRDMRTIVDVATSTHNFDKNSVKFEGVKHDALSDAMHQAKVISAAYESLKGVNVLNTEPSYDTSPEAKLKRCKHVFRFDHHVVGGDVYKCFKCGLIDER